MDHLVYPMLLYLDQVITFDHIKLKRINYFRITQRELVIMSHSLFVMFGHFKNEAIKQSKLAIETIKIFHCSLSQHSANVGAAC